jgi:hypothetical protein
LDDARNVGQRRQELANPKKDSPARREIRGPAPVSLLLRCGEGFEECCARGNAIFRAGRSEECGF